MLNDNWEEMWGHLQYVEKYDDDDDETLLRCLKKHLNKVLLFKCYVIIM